jgi:hypothetical protein
MNERFPRQPGQPEQPTFGMLTLRQIFNDVITGEDLINGLHEAIEAIRKKDVTIKDLASEIAATAEEREKLIESGAGKEEIDQQTLKLLGAQSIMYDLRDSQEDPRPE